MVSSGQLAEGVRAIDAAISLDPLQASHLRELGHTLWNAGQREVAVGVLMHGSKIPGIEASLLVDLAGMLIELGHLDAAAGAAMVAIERQPGSATAQAHLGRALFGLGQHQAALAPSIASVTLNPRNANAVSNLGAVLLHLGFYEQGLDFSRQATALNPALYQAYVNQAVALDALRRPTEAEAVSRAALAVAPHNPQVRHNLAAHLLGTGTLSAEAWTLYEARLQMTAAARAIADFPRWQGEDITGQTILLHAEQGLGDTLQFARYVTLVAERGARVILVVQPELVRLLRTLPGVSVVLAAGAPLPEFDWFCPLLSLPRAFGTTLGTIPGQTPYILPDPALVHRWRTPAENDTGTPLAVGVAWAGNRLFIHDATRSIPAAALAPLANMPGLRLHSLQKCHSLQNSDDGAPPVELLDRMAGVTDFADTAALIAGLDLVITIDSAVAHLAGAIGKEVWMLSRYTGCWRWLRNRADTPWYPTMQIYRQPCHGDWDSVLRAVRTDLEARVAARALCRGRVHEFPDHTTP